ncbi:MAG: polysaccharide deacetylase family protein [Streptosporangiaceae bacterium]
MITAPGTPVPILMYHEIAQPPETGSQLAVPPGAFAAQLGYLHDAGFQTVTAGTLAEIMNGGPGRLPDRAVVLTFDDGFEDFHRWALPLLARYGFTASLYVTTGWVQDAGPQSAGRRPARMLTWSQITEAAGAGIEIGAHSRQHPQLDQLSRTALREELRVSKAQLEDRLGVPVPGLAYPFGYSSAAVREEARDAGHGYACAVGNTLPGPRSDPLALPRLTVRRSTSMQAFRQFTHSRNVPMIFFKDRALTTGYAMARRTRAAMGRMRSGD